MNLTAKHAKIREQRRKKRIATHFFCVSATIVERYGKSFLFVG